MLLGHTFSFPVVYKLLASGFEIPELLQHVAIILDIVDWRRG